MPAEPTLATNDYASQSDAIWKVNGLADFWATKSGGATSAAVSEVWDGGAVEPGTRAAKKRIANIVVTRPYRARRDAALLNELEPLTGRWLTTLWSRDTDPDTNLPLEDVAPVAYPGARLVGVTPPEHSNGSNEGAMISLEFAVPRRVPGTRG